MNLNDYIYEVGEFLQRIGATKEDVDFKIKMLDEKFRLLKESVENPEKLKHQIYDMVFLLFEIASDYDFDLEEEWNKGKEKKQKKYNGN